METTSGVQAGLFAVPNGGGGLRSLGESFTPDLLRGSGSYAVPIDLPAGPNGIRPQLGLRYATGQGNGPYGLGWQLTGPPAILRGTENGVPRYSDADPLLLGGDVLVDVGDGRFRPRSDTQFWDIRRDGDGWRIRTKEGVHYRLGASPQSRIADGDRVFGWLCEEQIDQAGNAMSYRYLRDGGQLYLSEVAWSIFRLRLTYEPRPDVAHSGRSGFPLVTALRCTRIERHVTRPTPTRCASHVLRYEQAAGSDLSLLVEVRLEADDPEVAGRTEAHPPLRFGYRPYEPEPRFLPVTSEDGRLPLGEPDAALVDLDGDGLPDVLQTNRSGHRYWKNLGGHFAAARTLPGAPAGLTLGEPGVSFADLTGDGTADLFRAGTRLSVVARNLGTGRWSEEPQVLDRQVPLAVAATTTRLIDLDGDGVTDLLQSGLAGFTMALNRGEDGWAAPEVVPRIPDASRFPDIDLDDDEIYLADMTGDGLTDLVAVYSGRVCYWPALGPGRWGGAIEMERPPALPRGFTRNRLFLTDLDGDGTTDLLYVDGDRIQYWLNRSGRGWSEAFELAFVPPPNVDALYPVDLLGTGMPGLCWATSRAAGPPARFLDLSSGVKPYLLTEVDNGFGGRTRIEYTSSTTLRREDPDGDAWHTFLPFPLHVVRALVETDDLTGQRIETRFAYERGYFDPIGRVFRGFAAVETSSVGDAYRPTVVQRTSFNLGAMLGPEERFGRTPRERAHDHALSGSTREVAVFEEAPDQTRTLVSTAVTDWEVREEFAEGDRFVCFPHLRQTTATDVAPGVADRIDVARYDVDEFGNVVRKRRTTRFADADPADAHVSEQLISYALDRDAWLVGLPERLSTRDGAGRLLDDKLVRYDGPAFTGLPAGQVSAGLVRRSEELVLADWALPAGYVDALDPDWGLIHRDEGWYKVAEAYAHDARGNVVGQRDSLGRTTTIDYDDDRLFPVRATDAAGHVTAATFDPRTAQPAVITTPTGTVIRYAYTPLGRLEGQSETAADGSVPLTQFFRVVHPDMAASPPQPAHIVSVRPHDPGRTLAELRAADLQTEPRLSVEYSYVDGRGNLLQRSRRAARNTGGWVVGARARYTRGGVYGEEFPNVHADSPAFSPVTDAAAAVRFTYGPTGQVRRLEHPDGGRFTVDYLLSRVEKRDAETADDAPPLTEHYNALGHLVGVDSPDGNGTVARTRYEVDHAGRMRSILDAEGQTTTRYTYAGPGPAIQIRNAEAGTRTYVRDAVGNLRMRRDGDGRTLVLAYDDAGRLTTATDATDPAAPRVVREQVYADGALVRQVEDGLVTTFRNDRLGRPTAKTVDFGGGEQLTLERVYGLQGDVSTLVYPDGHRVDFPLYDGGQVRAIPGLIDQVEYDMHDNPLELDFGGAQATYGYDPAMKRLERLELRRGATPLRRLAFAYDRNGCITTAVDQLEAVTTAHRYTYDAMLRLTRTATLAGGLGGTPVSDQRYGYRLTGDITQQGESGALLHYDDAEHPSRLTRVERGGVSTPMSHDAAGRLTGFGDIAAVDYDIWDRITRAELADGTTVRLAYDEAGRQVRRTVARPDGSTTETRFVEGLYEQGPTGARANIYLGTLLVGVRTTPPGSAPVTACVLTDHLGSILTTCDPAGATVRHQDYTPFGLPRLAVTDDTRYTGVPADAQLGLVQLGARWYAPELGRFVTPDWFILENPSLGVRLPQSLNVYSYAINSPVMLRDPSGKFFGLDDLIVAGIGFVVGFVTGVIVGIAEGRSFGDTLLLGLEAGLLGAAGAWLAYITLGAATAALGAIGLGMGSGVATGLAVGAAVVGGLNGVISGATEIYDWSSWTGWASFLADSSWGLIGTTFAVLLHGINLFYGGDRNYVSSLSKRQNRHVYDGGFGFGTYAFTQGNVISNLNGVRTDLVDHETEHIFTSRVFGPVFQVTYIAWLVVGGVVGFLVGIGVAIGGGQGIGQSIMDVAYYNNPWETHAYTTGGSASGGGDLSWA